MNIFLFCLLVIAWFHLLVKYFVDWRSTYNFLISNWIFKIHFLIHDRDLLQDIQNFLENVSHQQFCIEAEQFRAPQNKAGDYF